MNETPVLFILATGLSGSESYQLRRTPVTGTTYPASIMDDAKVSFVPQLPGLLKLGVRSLLLNDFLHKALISGFGEPAFLIQQSQDPWGVCLRPSKRKNC